MSKLEFLMRPLVAFDPSNKDHRRYYAEYLDYGGWGRCPVRFICPDDIGMDLPTMIKNRLVEFYIGREFGGTDLTQARAEELSRAADEMYKRAGQLRKEAELVRTTPRRI
jgi:hypothetical protein